MDNNSLIVKFVDDYKVQILDWLRKNHDNFPFVCSIASDIVGSFLYSKLGTGGLVYGRYEADYLSEDGDTDEDGNPLPPFHAWIECDDFLLDFTAFQFFLASEVDVEALLSLPSDELYKLCCKYQKSFIVHIDSPEINLYYPNTKYEYRFSSIAAASDSFEDYLSKVLISMEFKDFCYNTGLKKIHGY